MSQYTYENLSQYSREVDSLYNKYVLDPLAKRIALPILNLTDWKPYFVTLISLTTALISAALFLNGVFLVGAILFQISVVLDCVDGYVARAKQNGSVFGIMLDVYSDMIRIFINVLALSFYFINDIVTVVTLLLFLVLNFAESFLAIKLSAIRNFLLKQKSVELNRLDLYFLKLKDGLKPYGLKVNLLYFQERIFCVLFLGPVFGMVKLFTFVGVILVLVSIHLKLFLDIALIKQSIIDNEDIIQAI